jgi:DNA-binding PadR family transcriptional regulator
MSDDLGTLGRYTGPATLILSSLAGGAKHGYALMQDIEAFADVTLRPGTLYGALSRLEAMELIEPLEGDGRRRPYRLTHAGAAALQAQLSAQRRVAEVGLSRLTTAGVTA